MEERAFEVFANEECETVCGQQILQNPFDISAESRFLLPIKSLTYRPYHTSVALTL